MALTFLPKESGETTEAIAHSTFKYYKGEFVEEEEKGWQRTRMAVAASGSQGAREEKRRKKIKLGRS